MSGDDFAAAEENGDAAAAPDLFRWLSREVRELMPREVPVLESPPTALAFSRDFVAANRPCVVRGAVDHWPARELWTASYLSAALGDTPVSVNVTPTGLGDALLSTEGVDLRYEKRAGASGASSSGNPGNANHHQRPKERDDDDPYEKPNEKPPLVFVQPEARRMTFREFQALAREGAKKAPKIKTHLSSGLEPRQIPYVSAQDGSFASEFSACVAGDLGADAKRGLEWAFHAFGSAPDAVNVWCGPSDAVTSFHRDHYENVYVVLRGSKTFTLLPPCDAWRMAQKTAPAARFEYVASDDGEEDFERPSNSIRETKRVLCRVVVETPVSNVSWPSATPEKVRSDGGPKPFVVTVNAGETLYLPAMWYHHVEQGEGSVPREDENLTDEYSSDSHTIAVNFWHDMRFDDRFATATFLETARERMLGPQTQTDE